MPEVTIGKEGHFLGGKDKVGSSRKAKDVLAVMNPQRFYVNFELAFW